MTRTAMTALAAALLLGAMGLLGACAGPKSAALVHPEKMEGLPICTSCHDAGSAAVNHDAGRMKSHGAVALRAQRTCELCHQVSSCADCHAGRQEEIKPSDKSSRFDPATPHHGDWLSQHQVEGRLDPASCFGCHGRKNVGRCATCHK